MKLELNWEFSNISLQETLVENGGEKARGFVRVQLLLRRPINVISGQQPPPVYNISNSTLSERSTIRNSHIFAITLDNVNCELLIELHSLTSRAEFSLHSI